MIGVFFFLKLILFLYEFQLSLYLATSSVGGMYFGVSVVFEWSAGKVLVRSVFV